MDSIESRNAEALAGETRSARVQFRTKPTMKRTIRLAATLTHMDISEFVAKAAYEAALKAIEAKYVIRLNEEQTRQFFEAMERAAAEGPTQAMIELMEDYEASIENAIR